MNNIQHHCFYSTVKFSLCKWSYFLVQDDLLWYTVMFSIIFTYWFIVIVSSLYSVLLLNKEKEYLFSLSMIETQSDFLLNKHSHHCSCPLCFDIQNYYFLSTKIFSEIMLHEQVISYCSNIWFVVLLLSSFLFSCKEKVFFFFNIKYKYIIESQQLNIQSVF